MKLTKKLEKEILKLYNKYWNAYLNGKMKTMASLMDKNCHVISSGMGEVFNNKKDAVKYYTDTAGQVSGKSEVRNKKINVMLAGSNILVTEESDYFVFMDKSWTFYGQARISTLFGKSKNKWKIIQQHGSLPDSRTNGGEQLNTDKIKEENLRLKEAIKRRTIELENKNRELEIEAALEKVRVVAMSMSKPDDLLNVCEVLFKEFHSFGFSELRNAMINIHNDAKKTFVNYDYSDKIGESVNHLEYNLHPVIKKQIKKIRSADDAFSETVFKGEDLKSWKAFRKKIGENNDPRINKSTALYYYFYSIGAGSIGISTFSPIGKEKLQLLKRFRNVFKLSYQRYKYIEKAKAQAREATIEAALERVRSLALGMRKSEDVGNVTDQFFTQLTELGVDVKGCSIVVIDEDNDKMELWRARSNIAVKPFDSTSFAESMDLLKKYMPDWFSIFIKALGKRNNYLIDELLGKRRSQFINLIAKQYKYSSVEKSKLLKNAPKKITAHYIFFKLGYLGLLAGKKLSDQNLSIARRFVEVFDFAYTRFLDIKKAEAQAREAQIELALERVRASAMAMHNSNDVGNATAIMFTELEKLGIETLRCGIEIMDKNKIMEVWATSSSDKGEIQIVGKLDSRIHPHLQSVQEAWERQDKFISLSLEGQDLKEYYEKLSNAPDYRVPSPNIQSKKQFNYDFFFKEGGLFAYRLKPFTEEEVMIFQRFTAVFGLTFRRYLDLKKAEAQAREAKIEMSLEKVRTVALTMKRSDEMLDIAQALYEQLLELGFTNIRNAIIDLHNEEDETFLDYDYSHDMGKTVTLMSYHDHPIIEKQVRQIQSSSDAFFELVLEGQELQDLIDIRLKNGEEEDSRLRQIEQLTYNLYSFGNGAIGISNFGLLSDDQKMVLKRFRNVFAFAYKRYSDMVQSEKQAKEAQIEAALERVRSRSMAMHKSDELADTAAVLFEQMVSLGIVPKRCVISIINQTTNNASFWLTSSDGKVIPGSDLVPLTEEKHLIETYRAWKEKKTHFSFKVFGEERLKWTKYVIDKVQMHLPEYQPDTINKGQILNEPAVFNSFFFSHGFVMLHTVDDLAEDQIKMLKRFASVFEQTYTRFLDLQKAEAQAREAEIEAALERVRSKTMAMHNSKDVGATVVALFDEVLKLGLDKSIRVGIGILEGNEGMETWSATSNTGGEVDLKMGMLDMTIHPMLIGLKKAWESSETGYSYDYIGDDVFRYYEALNNEPEYPFQADLDSLPENEYHKSFFYREGILFSFAPNPISDETAKVLDRFAGVFGQTYRRYLDLQKAEEQAREAQIEAALERVRSQAMAMHSSEDLGMTVDTFFAELKSLNVSPHRCGVGIVDGETRIVKIQAIDTNQNNETKKIVGDLKLAGHPVLDKVFEYWVKQTEYYPVLRGKEILEYYKVMDPQVKFHEFANDEVQYGYYFYFKEGGVYAWTDNELQEQDIEIFRRYTSVLSLTYRRYLELRDAEARALESVRQASLDRVRAEIASMRTSEDLNHITPIIWRELKNLEVPFFRCGVFIVDKENKKVRVYLTTPDGKSLGVLNLPFDVNTLTTRTVDYWQKKEVYKEHWNKDEFINWTKSMMELGQVASAETYQGSAVPPESLYLHFVPFTQGMLYVGDVKPLTDEKLELVKILAEAFSIAYARYEDFKHLEEAKTKIEITLDELRSAQAQLVHAEKMASLGELTAGIAHEIKNPLNFVNNFSEVSRELLDEMQIEIKNNNIEEVIELVEDLKQNLEKINTHGKRADSIVKGMLLHSRGTSGEKTLTDINDLLDQYVNLAYHGMRATNKEFNITIEKDYDKSIEKINVVHQDISRVFLNIINNACYAAFDRKKQGDNNFNPVLNVSTKNQKNKVEIIIGDNGNGIPANLIDKIFQPFFTTKPTGEGTGLGLSLSYDIVTKVHGGDLKVETKHGEGTEFLILLPSH